MAQEKSSSRPKPLILAILDGWGQTDNQEANAIAMANKPFWKQLMADYPHTTLEGSGTAVGLPNGQMGNSEVGHLIMGAGRVVYQDLCRVDQAIADGDFFTNKALNLAMDTVNTKQSTLHVMGLLSPGGVHSHESHIKALLKLAQQKGVAGLRLHAFLDGRDTPPKSALDSIVYIEKAIQEYSVGDWAIASVTGRYYAMDRDKRWERTQQAYDLLSSGRSEIHASSAEEAVLNAYARNETDEFVKPTCIREQDSLNAIKDDDAVVFMNFRADRARQLTEAFTDPNFSGFERKAIQLGCFVTLTEYDKRFTVDVAFPPISLTNILAECISRAGLSQLRVAETEKYAHVTFFFNGGVEEPVANEDRKLVPSPKVATYDLQPEMSAEAITDTICHAIEAQKYDVIICNYANPDMVGHTGNIEATIKAIETVDGSLQRIGEKLAAYNGELLITADHGNAEKMFNFETNQPHTAHTSDPVPFIYFGPRPAKIVKNDGKLSDIAPTMLYLLGLPIPDEMTGTTILNLAK